MMQGTLILVATLVWAALALIALHRWTQDLRDSVCSTTSDSPVGTLQGGMFWLRILEKGPKIGELGQQPIFEWMDVALDANDPGRTMRLYPHIGEEVKKPERANDVFLQAGRILYTRHPDAPLKA